MIPVVTRCAICGFAFLITAELFATTFPFQSTSRLEFGHNEGPPQVFAFDDTKCPVTIPSGEPLLFLSVLQILIDQLNSFATGKTGVGLRQ